MQSKHIMRLLKYLLATIIGKYPIFIGLMKKGEEVRLVHLGAYERHYNRKVGSPGAQGNTDYANYLDQEQRTFNSNLQNPNKSKCKLALKALGRMSHSWQDFFAHAIQIDDKSWVAWSAGVTGTPDDTGSFFPSSYSFNPLGGSEHPPYSEPIQPGNVECGV